MKKVKLFNYINLAIIFIFLFVLIIQGVFKILPIDFARFYFPAFLFFVACSLLAKFIIFHNQSILWFCCVLFCFSALMFLIYFIPLPFYRFWPLYILVPALCSFVVGIIFKDYLQLSIASSLFSVGFPLFLLTLDILSVWKFLVLLFISLLLGSFVVNICIGKIRKNRKKHNV